MARRYHLVVVHDCEHCDGVYSDGKVREDRVRGTVCAHCDRVLDALFGPQSEAT